MERLFEHLRPVVNLINRRPAVLLLVAILLSVVSGLYASRLKIDSDLSQLIPSSYSSVQALERLRAHVGGESEAALAIESPSFEANKQFAEALIPRILALKGEGRTEPYFSRVEYKKDVSFLQNNALYFATNDELDSLESFLNDQIEEARLKANPFYFEVEEDEEESGDSAAQNLAQVYDRLVGSEYPISKDSTVMVLRFYPTGAQTDMKFISDAYADVEKLVASMTPASFHPEMKTTLAGRLLRQKIEVETITRDVTESFGAGVLAVILLVSSYFFYKSYQARAGRRLSRRVLLSELARIPVTALIIGVPLLAAILWTGGVTYLVYEKLNLMTSTLGLVLFGLGIDYGIHFYARYAEERGAGLTVTEAIERTFMSTGQAITATSSTTAAAFYLLMIADFRGFSEFGFIAGTGIVFALLSMLLVMPSLIVVFERTRLLNLSSVNRVERDPVGPDEAIIYPLHRAPRAVKVSRAIVLTSLVLLAGAIISLPKLEFEYDFGKLDPVYEDYNKLQDKVRAVHTEGGMRNPAYVVVDDASEVPAIEAAIRKHMATDTTKTIRTVESMQARFPMTPAQAQAKLARIDSIRTLIDDPFLAASESEDLERLQRAAGTTRPISLEEVPKDLKATFTAKDGSIGRLLVIYPAVGLSDGKNSINFAEDVGTITTEDGRTYHAGSTSIVAADMLRLMKREAPFMVLLTILLIVGMKLIILRNLKWTLMALIPLSVGFTWMFGLMVLFDLKLNFYNLVVLPTVLGIGDDAGIHLVHRYLEEGKGSVGRVLRSTGEHITMSAITAGLGFAGQLLSFYPGLRSIGDLAVLGIGLTLLTALVMLPAMLRWFEYSRPESAPVVHNHAA